jgi:DNA-binding transcriptional regulator YhcF (GntR family)
MRDGFAECHIDGIGEVEGRRGPKDRRMRIVLTKDSDVPLRQQIAEQIVFLITTGQLQAGYELPSVRALGRQSDVHYNTISEAYQDLVNRGWLTRHRGSRLAVGKGEGLTPTHDLDLLINETIQLARKRGYSLQELRMRVRERLLIEPPDHILVIEQDPGLRAILQHEAGEKLNWSTRGCTFEEFEREPGLAIGAQVLVANHLLGAVQPLVSQSRPAIGLVYSPIAEQLDLIQKLKKPSIVAVASVSETLLRTARSVMAAAVGRRHTFQEILAVEGEPVRIGAADLIFCDSITFGWVRSRKKAGYQLVTVDCLEHIAASLVLT